MYEYIGVIHLCGMFIENLYGFLVIKNDLLDKIYIITFVTIPFSWIIFRDECIISYIAKKVVNTDYILGSDPENIEDITNLLDKVLCKENQDILLNICSLLRIYSIYIVNLRTTRVCNTILLPTCVLYFLYKEYRKLFYPYIQILFCLYIFSVMFSVARGARSKNNV